MPSDIRSFFGGKPAQSSPDKKSDSAKKAQGNRRIIEDSDDDVPVKKVTPKKSSAKAAKRHSTPEAEATTTSDYFAATSKSKQKKSLARATPAVEKTPQPSPAKTASASNTPSGRHSIRRKPPVNYNESDSRAKVIDDEDDGKDDIFAAEYEDTGGWKGDDHAQVDASSNGNITRKRTFIQGKKLKASDDDYEAKEDVNMRDADEVDNFIVPDEDDAIIEHKQVRGTKPKPKAGAKRKSPDDDEDEYDTPVKKAKGSKITTPKKAAANKKAAEPQSAEMQAIFESIPTVLPPTPPAQGDSGQKFKFGGHANSGPPPAAGSKELPEGADNCLSGLSFVFTGLLESLGREEGQILIKRYGGKVMSAPSSKTSYVVLGNDAGPKKLETIKKHGLKTINEDGLFELIRRLPANGGDHAAAAKSQEKKQAEEEKAREEAVAMEKAERKAMEKAESKVKTNGVSSKSKSRDKSDLAGPDSRLWTVKYAPQDLRSVCGNKAQVERLQRWLKNFPRNQKTGFKMAGADGSGIYRAILIHGPPGIGKTTAAHLVAKLEGYDVVESNASDTRSKKLIEQGLRGVLSTASLLGYFAADGEKVDLAKKKLVLIMDEVDGMSAGDRGGVGAMAAVCKKSQIPLILICNDRRQPKMKPFQHCTYDLPFRRPTTDMIRSRIMTIAFREGLKLPTNVIDALIEGSGADIRQVINMVSTAKLDEESLDYDKGKKMSKSWEKHIVLKPWDILGKILGGGMFASSSKATLNDKIELYFNDHEFSFLMLQENYLGTTPMAAGSYQGKERNLKVLELAEKAAASVSDGDLVDRMIHGPEQQWSLMPTHAVFSFVRPASFVAGSMAGHGQSRFPEWLGRNSSQGKFSRQIKEIQGHMRLRASGDRHEIRQTYIPSLWTQLIKKLEVEGKDAVQSVIDLMDSYYLTKEDWDSILELGVGTMDQEMVKLETQTKATFTRLYNQQNHPMPFMKASNVIAPKNASKAKPDLEEALDESDDGEVVEDVKEEEDDLDLSKDKYVKAAPKKKKGEKAAESSKAGAKRKGKKKSRATNGDEEDGFVENGTEEETKPEKAAKGKGRAKN